MPDNRARAPRPREIAMAVAVTMWLPQSAHAWSGGGLATGDGGFGGEGSWYATGQGSYGGPIDGSGVGGTGGAGGGSAVYLTTQTAYTGTETGYNGGNGQSAADAGIARGGGGGGAALQIESPSGLRRVEARGLFTGGAGGAGGASAAVNTNATGWGSGGGGGGGDGIGLANIDFVNHATVTGGKGGAGGASNVTDGGRGGAGGAGGNGVWSASYAIIGNLGVVRGGEGGDAGQGGTAEASAGRGGDGVRANAAFLTNSGTINGGTGGYGASGFISGAGGNGVAMGAGTLTNYGTITGGAGGTAGGAGVVMDGGAGSVQLTNTGVIIGGNNGAGVREDAVRLTGSAAYLTLHGGSAILGNVVNSAAAGRLTLGGDAAGNFDASLIGDTAQYRGFDQFVKSGNSAWTLTGATGALTPWRLEHGVLAVSSDAALGAPAGGLTFDGGRLRATGDTFTTLARAVSVQSGGGEVEVAQALPLTISGAVSGVGRLTKSGTGTLVLTGANTHGGVVAQRGTIVGDASSFGGSIDNRGGVVRFRQDSDATYAGNVVTSSGHGIMEKSGAGTLTLTGISTLAWLIEDGALVSTAQNFSGNISAATAGATFRLNQASNGTYAGVLGGVGIFDKTGAAALTLTRTSVFSGTTRVGAGTLRVDGALLGTSSGGNIVVQSGGTLTGSGTVSRTTVASGGTLSASSLNGTLTVDGDLDLQAGSDFHGALGAPSATPLVNVLGNVTMAGTLSFSDAGGLSTGVYRLMNYGGSLTVNGLSFGTLPAGTNPSDYTIQFLAQSRQINLVNSGSATLQFWDGGDMAGYNNGIVDGGAGTWATAGNTWTDSAGQFNGPARPSPGFAIFQGNSGTVTVDGSAGAVSATGMQFAVDGYRVEGDAIALAGAGGESVVRVGDGSAAGQTMRATIAAALTGDTALVKQDSGTLVLSGVNTYQRGTRVLGGTLQIEADHNLGLASTGVTLRDGKLATTADIATARGIVLDGEGAFDVASGTTLALSGNVSGGTLDKQGEGTLRLSGANDYAATRVFAGTLAGSAASLRGDIANAGTVVFEQDGEASFDGKIAALGGVRGVMQKTGSGTLRLNGGSALDWTVGAGRLVASAGRYTGNTAIAYGGTFELDQSTDATYGGVVSGTGALQKSGAGALTLSGDSGAYAGSTTVSAGTLVVGVGGQGTLGGNVAVRQGATLSGSGSVGSAVIGAGGTLAPGNGVGKLGIKGDLSFEAGSSYRVEAAADGSSDLVEVGGTARLGGGSVIHVGPDGQFSPSMRYTILRAAAVDGRFASVASDYAYLTAALDYSDPNTVGMTLERREQGGASIRFADLAASANQRAVANALETLPHTSSLYQAVLTLPDGAPAAAFNALSGEAHASASAALVGASSAVRTVPLNRLRANLSAGLLPGVPTAQASIAQPVISDAPSYSAAVLPRSAAMPAWAQIVGNWERFGGGEAAAVRQNTGGVFVGADHELRDSRWRLGASLGYTDGRARADDVGSSADIRSYNAALYGGSSYEAGAGKLNMMLGGAYTWHEIDTRRRVDVASLNQTLTADYSANNTQLFTEFGYALPLGARAAIEPFAGVAWSDQRTRGFTERGGDAALAGQSRRDTLTNTSLGVRMQRAVTLGTLDLDVSGALGWRHAFGDVSPETTLAFQGSQPFTVAGAPIARDAALVEVGVGTRVGASLAVGIGYSGQFGGGNRANAGNLNVRWRY